MLEQQTKGSGHLFIQHLYGSATLCRPGSVLEEGDTAVKKKKNRTEIPAFVELTFSLGKIDQKQ